MTFQTDQKNENNRYKNSPEGLNPELCSIWLGWRDSNPRMPGPKPGALPLGDIPIELTNRVILPYWKVFFNVLPFLVGGCAGVGIR